MAETGRDSHPFFRDGEKVHGLEFLRQAQPASFGRDGLLPKNIYGVFRMMKIFMVWLSNRSSGGTPSFLWPWP
jgi:hypothetical protein